MGTGVAVTTTVLTTSRVSTTTRVCTTGTVTSMVTIFSVGFSMACGWRAEQPATDSITAANTANAGNDHLPRDKVMNSINPVYQMSYPCHLTSNL